jgi:hypothetical protein
MDMRFGTWNIRSLYRSGSLQTVSGELTKYKLDSVGVKVRWDKGSTEPANDYTFFYGKGNADHHLGTGFFKHKSIIISAIKKVEFESDRMSYITLRGRRCYIIVLNVHAPTEDS